MSGTTITATTGLDALLTPENSVLVLIDHQPFQFANLRSHEPTVIVNNVVALGEQDFRGVRRDTARNLAENVRAPHATGMGFNCGHFLMDERSTETITALAGLLRQ
jgi:hypothetical protein